MTQHLMADTDAAVVEIDLSAWRQQVDTLVAENARLTEEVERLKAQLAEARRQPVRLLPEITSGIVYEMHKDWLAASCRQSQADIYNIVLRRHFREAAEARTKPTLDVEAVVAEMQDTYDKRPSLNFADAARLVLRRHLTDVPAPPADETLAAAVNRVERETQRSTWRKCAERIRAHRTRGCTDWDGLANAMERGE